MTDAPIDIPLDERGAPDLQLLVRQLGQAAAAAGGEEYDPRNKREHGGYQYMTPAIWKAFDEAMTAYQQARRDGLTSPPIKEGDLRPPRFGPIEKDWGFKRCVECSREAEFGYRNEDGTASWFCAEHRLALNWSGARRQISTRR
jgi:hypothetical protein